MQGRTTTSLQDSLNHSGIVNKLVDNLCAVRENMGIEAFNFFIDSNDTSHATGRLYYKVEMTGKNPNHGQKEGLIRLTNPELPVDDRTAGHVYGRFEACRGKTDQLNIITSEIGEMINSDPRFIDLMSEFENKYSAEEAEKLRNFAVSQGAYRVLEVCAQDQIQHKMTEMTNVSRQLKEMQSGEKKLSRSDKKTIEELQKKEQQVEQEYKSQGAEVNKVLGSTRQGILGYDHSFDADACKRQDAAYMKSFLESQKTSVFDDLAAESAKGEQVDPRKTQSDPTPSKGSYASLTSSMSEGRSSPKAALKRAKKFFKEFGKASSSSSDQEEDVSQEQQAEAFPGVRHRTELPEQEGGNKDQLERGSPSMQTMRQGFDDIVSGRSDSEAPKNDTLEEDARKSPGLNRGSSSDNE